MAEAEGKTTLFLEAKINIRQMRDWDPARIVAFFAGVAQVVAACEGEYDLKILEQLQPEESSQ